ncbi:MAG: aspartate aminotransferase family protein [candidate division NC10 bacterium]
MLDIQAIIRARRGDHHLLHSQYVNPVLAKVLRIIGFDKTYVRAKGSTLYDAEGQGYLDFLAGWGVFNVGRNHPWVIQALRDVLDLDLANLVQMDTPLLSGLLAEALVKRAPAGIDAVHFVNSGAEATEAAMKFSRCATKKPRILFCDHGFHGLTYGALSVTSNGLFREGFAPLLPGCKAIPFNDLEALEAELSQGDVAAFIVEPIQGEGVNVPSEDYLPGAQRLCRKHGTLLIVDEILTGIGRTGKFFGFEHWDVQPDVIAVAKGLSAGLVPVGAVLMGREIFRATYSRLDRCVACASTFSENNLAMAAGLATLRILDEEDLVGNAARMGERLVRELQRIQETSGIIRQVRGKGLLIGVEFGEPDSIALRIQWKLLQKVRPDLFAQIVVTALMTDHRILTEVAGSGLSTLKLRPPLSITESEVATFVQAFEATLERARTFAGPLWEFGMSFVKHNLAS